MKNNFCIPAKRLIERIDFSHKHQKVSQCYTQTQELYELENCLFRLGSLWDTAAQFVNVRDDLNQEPRNVTAEKIFGPNGKKLYKGRTVIDEDIQSIWAYYSSSDNFEGLNVRDFLRNMRNYLTHFFDLASGKFLSTYFSKDPELSEMAITLNVYPVSRLAAFVMADFATYISFFSKMIDDWQTMVLEDQ